jgi:hypothetical protein
MYRLTKDHMPQSASFPTVVVTAKEIKPDSNSELDYGRHVATGASDLMVKRGEIPMSIINVVLRALGDTRVHTATAYQALGVIARHADENGIIHPTPEGRLPSDPEYVSEMLGVTKAAVWRAYGLLDETGYISWHKAARGAERTAGVTGRVRILVPSAQ